jgi:hypothetical protein
MIFNKCIMSYFKLNAAYDRLFLLSVVILQMSLAFAT